ncbi:MAG: dTMP kinase [Patescibacteria group bacterium]|jgi:dTMP kinase
MANLNGIFITFEGGEGTGKSTQVKLLAEWLTEAKHDVFTLREPGGEETAEKIRQIILDPPSPLTTNAELLLFLASRSQVCEKLIKPHLHKGSVVICDRFIDSSAVYQGYVRGIELGEVNNLNLFATGNIKPDLTILLDIDPKIGLSRQEDQNRFEKEGLEFHQKIRQAYLDLAKNNPDRIKVVDASGTVDEVHEAIVKVIQSYSQNK